MAMNAVEAAHNIRITSNGHIPQDMTLDQAYLSWQKRGDESSMIGSFQPAFHHTILYDQFRNPPQNEDRETDETAAIHPKTSELVYQPLGSALREKRFDVLNHNGSAIITRGTVQKVVATIVEESLKDIPEGSESEVKIANLAPRFMDAIISCEDVRGVSLEYLGDVARVATEFARDPQLLRKTVIRTGYGGTFDPQLTTRYPAYMLPAIELHGRLVQAQIDGGIDPKDTVRPDIEFFYAPNAFIYVNAKNRDQVIKNAQNMQRVSREFINHFFPHLHDVVSYRIDKPMDEESLDPISKVAFDYLAHIVKSSDHEDVIKILRQLKGFGSSKGGDYGESMAAHYGALHAVLFQDVLDMPHAELIEKDNTHEINITIGGRPERLFNRIRQEVTDRATREGFMAFVRNRFNSYAISPETMDEVERWYDNLVLQEHTYIDASGNAPLPPEHLPIITLPLQGGIGEYPTYYKTEFDTYISDTVDPLSGIENDGDDIPPSVRDKRNEVSKDLHRLIEATGGIDNLVEFNRSIAWS